MLSSTIPSVLFYALIVFAATPAEWRNRVIYQVMTDRFARTDGSTSAPCNVEDYAYCGGTWQGLIEKLDYIHDMGFTAVWISPITQQILGSASTGYPYHGYSQNNLNALNPAFGSDSDLHALSDAIHERGMYLMVDVVVNHFGWPGTYDTVNYSSYDPFNDSSYFHPFCQVVPDDYINNQTAVENCWLGSATVELPDLNTTALDVISIYNAWISSLRSTYSIDGLRLDTIKQVQPSFYPSFNTAAGVYVVGECEDGNQAVVCPYQNYLDGLMNYPQYYSVTQAFQNSTGNMTDLVNLINSVKTTCKDTTLLGTFLENHDNPRFPSLTSSLSLAQNAIAFTLLADGIPILYQGQEQHFSGGVDPFNREAVWLSGYPTSATSPLYGFVARVNQVRNRAMAMDENYVLYQMVSIYSDENTIVLRKGFNGYQTVGVFSNLGDGGASYELKVGRTGFEEGVEVVEVLGCGQVVMVGDGESIEVQMGGGFPKVFYPIAQLGGSDICGY